MFNADQTSQMQLAIMHDGSPGASIMNLFAKLIGRKLEVIFSAQKGLTVPIFVPFSSDKSSAASMLISSADARLAATFLFALLMESNSE